MLMRSSPCWPMMRPLRASCTAPRGCSRASLRAGSMFPRARSACPCQSASRPITRIPGQRFVAAPVLGRPDVAAAGDLSVIVAGDNDAIKDVAPVLDAIGNKTLVVSDKPKTANLVKLSGNFLIAFVIESLGEAVALVAKDGVDRETYIDL